ncbi:MAG: hypothetical protein AAF227_06055 [Pseudomonadota bacterium]
MSDPMHGTHPQDSAAREARKLRIRAFGRARPYLRANTGALARLVNTYARVAALDPARRLLRDT